VRFFVLLSELAKSAGSGSVIGIFGSRGVMTISGFRKIPWFFCVWEESGSSACEGAFACVAGRVKEAWFTETSSSETNLGLIRYTSATIACFRMTARRSVLFLTNTGNVDEIQGTMLGAVSN